MPPAQRNQSSALPEGYREDNSKGKMLRFQESLPRLPVPSLQETAARYIKSVHPILTRAELEATQRATQEFIKPGGIGEALQKKLVAKREDPKTKNWMIDWWNFTAYLGYRDPVVPYVSYFYAYKDDKKRRDPSKRAASIVKGALKFKKMVDEGTLEPEYMRKAPICMDSYKYMFNACRIPARPADYPITYDPLKPENRFFVAIRKNRFYKIWHDVDGKELTGKELEDQFKQVYQLADKAGIAPGIGSMCSENRDIWTDFRKIIIDESPKNAEALETIQAASFVVCLDAAKPVTLEDRGHLFWHGDGTNRWFDKPLSFMIADNGVAGFQGEHSMMDGTPTHRLNDYICDQVFTGKLDLGDPNAGRSLAAPQEVEWEITPKVQECIIKAENDFREVIGLHDLRVQAYQGYGKGLIKKFKCSPDAYVQMIIQLAYYKMNGVSRPTYESAATRKFQLGRTETCRSVSDDSVAWVKAMNAEDATREECVSLFRKAIDSHVKYIADASDGKGVDRHLFGLKNIWNELPDSENGELPGIFKDKAYGYSSSWYLSTSQLSSEWFNGYGWSQVIDDGFGIAYMINENSIQFNIVCKKIGAPEMSFYLNEAANDMREMLEPDLAPSKAKL